MSDDTLILFITETANQHAYKILIGRYKDKIKKLCISILGDTQEAEDAMQEILLSLWQSLNRWDTNGQAKFSTWVYRVSFNKCIDIKRKRKPVDNTNHEELPCELQSAYSIVLQNQLSTRLGSLLKTLPQAQSLALRLYYYEELSVEEIGARLDKSEQSIRALLKRGKAALRDKMQDDNLSSLSS
ncbi:MAG: RNA polymerase sigma factor [Bdellovibrionales bacterium]